MNILVVCCGCCQAHPAAVQSAWCVAKSLDLFFHHTDWSLLEKKTCKMCSNELQHGRQRYGTIMFVIMFMFYVFLCITGTLKVKVS